MLSEPFSFASNHAVFADTRGVLQEGSPWPVLDPDIAEVDEEDPAEARRYGFSHVLSIPDTQGIANNPAAQTGAAARQHMLDALLHSIEKDAFIRLPDNDR